MDMAADTTSPDKTDPRLVLKAMPPRMRKSQLMRPRLSSERIEFADTSVIAVYAPGGFGKTSLLGQWRREWLQRGAVVAWLSLDENDDDERFVLGLAVSMRQATWNPVFDKLLAGTQSAARYECHVARAEEVSNLNSKEIAALVYGDLRNFIPDLPQPKGHYVNRWNTYLNCNVGEEARRPAIQSPIDNLLFIGDVVWLPHSSQWMEKTNVTAKWATNLILDKAGQKEGKITILPSAILSLPMKALASRHDVYLPEDEPA